MSQLNKTMPLKPFIGAVLIDANPLLARENYFCKNLYAGVREAFGALLGNEKGKKITEEKVFLGRLLDMVEGDICYNVYLIGISKSSIP